MKKIIAFVLVLILALGMTSVASAYYYREQTIEPVTAENFVETNSVYFVNAWDEHFPDCIEGFTTRKLNGDGTFTSRFHYNVISGAIHRQASYKPRYTGAYMEVDNIVRETVYDRANPVVFSYGPVNLKMYTGPEAYMGGMTLVKVENYSVARGELLHMRFETYKEIFDKVTSKETVRETILSEPGLYFATLHSTCHEPGTLGLYICIVDKDADLDDNVDKTVTAMPNTMKVTLNGKQVTCPSYLIGDNNFIKLRDIAYLLNGTNKQFDVYLYSTYTDPTRTTIKEQEVIINPYRGYTTVGGELTPVGNKAKTGTLNRFETSFMGEEVKPLMYNIDGYNYVKLREVADIVGFHIDYDDATSTVLIDTSKPFSK